MQMREKVARAICAKKGYNPEKLEPGDARGDGDILQEMEFRAMLDQARREQEDGK